MDKKRAGAKGDGGLALLGKHYVHKGNNSRTYPGRNSGTTRGGKITDGRC